MVVCWLSNVGRAVGPIYHLQLRMLPPPPRHYPTYFCNSSYYVCWLVGPLTAVYIPKKPYMLSLLSILTYKKPNPIYYGQFLSNSSPLLLESRVLCLLPHLSLSLFLSLYLIYQESSPFYCDKIDYDFEGRTDRGDYRLMAVQAQHPSSVFRVRNNIFQEFQESVSRNLLSGYNNYAGQHLLNGTAVVSDPQSELTCNISGSRKRSRGDRMAQTQHQQQMLHQHQPQPQLISQQFPFPNVTKDQAIERSTTAVPSTGLQLSYVTNRLQGSGDASPSGRAALVSSLASDLNSYLLHQDLETDSLLILHNEKLRSMLDDTRKRHCSSILSLLEKNVLKRLEEKEKELADASRRNAELEEKIKQMSAENQIWFNVAKNNEALVSSLKSSLEQIMLQNQSLTREGFGDSEEVAAVIDHDTQSSCYRGYFNGEEKETTAEKRIQANQDLRKRRSCKVCRENEASVLLLPCRHLCLCKSCESQLDSCPMCNSVKNASLQIFMS